MQLNEINDKTKEGRLLRMALAALIASPHIQVNGESLDGRQLNPDAMFDRIKNVVDRVYADQPVDEFEAAARPLIQYLANEHHPHHTAIVTNTGAQLMEGVKTTGEIMDYIKD